VKHTKGVYNVKKFFRTADKITEIVAWAGVALIVCLAVMYTVDVLGRLIFGYQFKGTFEIAQFLLCLIIFMSYPFAQSRRGHIHVGFIVHYFPRKVQYILLAFHFLWGSMICGIVAYALWTQGSFTYTSGKVTQVLGLPFYPVYYASSILMVLFAVMIFVDLIRAVFAVAGNTECQESMNKVFS